MRATVDMLRGINPRDTLLVIPCSKAKANGGEPVAHPARDWPQPLLRARAILSERAQLDESRLLPACRRYTGGFYEEAGSAITSAVDSSAPLIVISGGYGLARGDELIGTYDRLFHVGDWPPGLLESLLVREAGRLGVRSVVTFSAATGDYHVPVRRARWSTASAVERVLVVSAERGGGGQYFVPRALGRAFRAFWLGEPADCYPPTITVEQVHGAARPAADAARIAQLAGLLSDRARAEPPATFPKDAAAADAPGLYAWWGDEEAVRVIGGALGGQVGSLLYVGQAGATSRVGGKRSNATLASRIRGQHIRAQTRASTFARTMAAVLREPMQLELAAPGLLTEHSRQRLSCWICEHLQIAVVPVPAPDTLTAVEDAVLAALDPPLNLDAMPRTPQRRRLSELRSELGRAGPSALPAVTGPAAGCGSSAAAGLRPAADGFDEVWDRIRRHAGETFTLVRGQQFTYEVTGNNVLPAGRQRLLHKSNFTRAHSRMPLRATTDIKDVQGSSYVFAILTDPRISHPRP